MYLSYEDIRSRIAEPPRWFDPCGVPRYVEFEPHLATVYGREVALLEIACQSCGTHYVVATLGGSDPTLAEEIRSGEVRYGDPPDFGCCLTGHTMRAIELRILEYWTLEQLRWVRNRDLEVALRDWREEND